MTGVFERQVTQPLSRQGKVPAPAGTHLNAIARFVVVVVVVIIIII